MFKRLKTPILEIELSRILQNIFTYTNYPILQNGLHIDEILIFLKIQLNGTLKNTYIISNFECYNHNTSNL
jgi:hypothetical protein